MELTSFEAFSLEWAKACYAVNPTVENKKRLAEIKKVVKQKLKSGGGN